MPRAAYSVPPSGFHQQKMCCGASAVIISKKVLDVAVLRLPIADIGTAGRTIDMNSQEAFSEPLTACPLCGGVSIGALYTIDRYARPFTVDRCGFCGFQFMNPPLREEVLHGYYGEEYYRGTAEYAYHDERNMERFPSSVRDRRVQVLRRYAPGGNLLDVGASFGGLLDSAASCFTPYGIEVSPFAGRQARSKYGDHIHIGTLADHPFPPGYFSAITMIEVLEHIQDPVRSLRECHSLLAPGGVLVLQTANMQGLQAKIFGRRYAYYMPGHCSYFTKQNLTRCLERIGFGRIIAFHPVEFGLIPKLVKSRGSFKSVLDYRKWIRIALYHWISKLRFGNFAMTSSMVLYAIK
jgi:2-polyprenyl-3-methyl-5-hydroxy-6-metoxy-1,4-benzoquinol methylase